jgi:hypothetical protein
MAPELALADWLEELAVFGTPRRFQDSKTAHHLSEAIKYWRLVKLAIVPTRVPLQSSANNRLKLFASNTPPGTTAIGGSTK